MLIQLKSGTVYDPDQGIDGEVRDIFMRDGVIVENPGPGARIDEVHDVSGQIVMAGAIDIHTHIAGGNVNNARLLLPERVAGGTAPVRSTTETGHLYALMGFTTLVEPAVMPANAWHAHLEMADIPIADTAGLAVLGNGVPLLNMLHRNAPQTEINDYVAQVLNSTHCLGIKVINAGGAAAFTRNARTFALDDEVPEYGISSRRILQTLQHATLQIGVAHPVHVHCNNLGVPGSIDSILRTMEAAEGLPMHLAHVQFYGYGTDGKKGFSSGAAQLIEAWNQHKNITIDVGQVLFGPTVTISGDLIAQYGNSANANPRKWTLSEVENEGGGGVVPFTYRGRSFVNVMQWAIGLELFLLAHDPSRLFLTTDHPNGAPFTLYPELFRLLMDADYRAEAMSAFDDETLKLTLLPEIKREYTLYEIAIMTRSAAARLLGLSDRGSLAPGRIADIATYTPQANKARMFARATRVFKDGQLVVRDGEVVASPSGRTIRAQPHYDGSMRMACDTYLQDLPIPLRHMSIDPALLSRGTPRQFTLAAHQ
ncbi:formylmethanofuran dehydrogenase subunit A [Xanthobacter sp. TB0139]|uniref:formylmethanofuran dehydrogenase subunit A n=1 Tax=Xanthobacter sp. TB0139 TaxID=3459178 RepID=UPI004039BC51